MSEDWKSLIIVVGSALALLRGLARLFARRAENEGKRLEREAQHLRHMQDQVDRLKALDDARGIELGRLRDNVLFAEVRRAQLETELGLGQRELALLRLGVEECEKEREDEQRRAHVLARELAELKREVAAGYARVTPIRPPKGRQEP